MATLYLRALHKTKFFYLLPTRAQKKILQLGIYDGPAKGQLISKCLFGVICCDQNSNENVLRISTLASKKRSDQKVL